MTIHSAIGLREKIGVCMETFMAVAKSCVEKFIRLDARLHTWNRPPLYKQPPTPSKMEVAASVLPHKNGFEPKNSQEIYNAICPLIQACTKNGYSSLLLHYHVLRNEE